jgi:catechol 2,3-dioxygenase
LAGDDSYRISANLAHVGLAAPDPEALARFYREVVGLHPLNPSSDAGVRLGLGLGEHVLELSRGSGLDHFALELPDRPAVEALAERLERNGVEATSTESDGLVVATRDPDGNLIRLRGPVDRSGERIADSGRRPIRVHHVTLGSSQVGAMVEFYTSVLGFRVSDRMGEVFVWLRSNREHHTVAVVESGTTGLDHYAYEIGGWDELKTWCDELAVRDVPLTWGPGRHGPGNNLFVMFDDPAGNRIELSCEMERYWDDRAEYTPRTWSPGARTINLWGPAPAWRERVAG